jgi:hypothetical protein
VDLISQPLGWQQATRQAGSTASQERHQRQRQQQEQQQRQQQQDAGASDELWHPKHGLHLRSSDQGGR